MTLLSEPARTAKIRLQRTTVAAVKERLTAELQDLNALNREITTYVREVRHVVRNLKSGKNDHALKSVSGRLVRACRIALLESEKSQTAEQIRARIERRASFCFSTSENAEGMICRALAEMAAAGEARCRNGVWERPTLVESQPQEAALRDSCST
jgi:hypothetical protein